MIFFKKVRGTQDIYPPKSELYQNIRKIIEKILFINNYSYILFPTFEYYETFNNSLGNETDIINKEMFLFLDRKKRTLAMRPEGTISTARLVCENKIIKENIPLKFYYWANMFRYERPQKGRYREFWQLGVEFINSKGFITDYQLLKLITDILNELEIYDFFFSLNYLGNIENRNNYKKKIENIIDKNKILFCVNCQLRYKKNTLRILDCKICEKNINIFPSYEEFLDNKDKEYIKNINNLLKKNNIKYDYDYHLVRGLDYYTGIVFEVKSFNKKSILGGGRYDDLYEKMGKRANAIGFAIGIERLIDYLKENNIKLKENKNNIDIFFFLLTDIFYSEVLFWKEKFLKFSLITEFNLEIINKKKLSIFINYYKPRLLIILEKKHFNYEKIKIKDILKNKIFFVEKNILFDYICNYLKKNN